MVIASVTLVLAGISTVPVTPLGFVFSIELTHPLQPILVNGFLMMCAQIMSLIMSIGMSLLSVRSPLGALGLFAVLSAVSAVSSFFIKEELKLRAAS
jgi:hypothetical protein